MRNLLLLLSAVLMSGILMAHDSLLTNYERTQVKVSMVISDSTPVIILDVEQGAGEVAYWLGDEIRYEVARYYTLTSNYSAVNLGAKADMVVPLGTEKGYINIFRNLVYSAVNVGAKADMVVPLGNRKINYNISTSNYSAVNLGAKADMVVPLGTKPLVIISLEKNDDVGWATKA